MRRHLRTDRRRTAGSGLIDYLVLTCAIAAIMFPVLQAAVFGPLEEAIFTQREGLVNFIGQSRKQPVPNEWFGAKEAKQAAGSQFQDQQLEAGQNIDQPNPIDDPQGLQAKNLDAPKNINNPSKLDTGAIGRPDSIAPPDQLSADRLNDPGQLNAANGGSGGGGSGGGSALGNDFFSGEAGKGGIQGAGGDVTTDAKGNESKGSRRSGGGFDFDEATGGGGSGDAALAKKNNVDKGEASKGNQTVAGGVEARRRGMAAEDNAREAIDNRSRKIDWSKVIRIVIILLILFLVMLIILSNAKRMGGR